MKLARFWTRQTGEAAGKDGKSIQFVGRGWSNESMEAAAALARDLATRVAKRIASGQPSTKEYGYGDRPLPEPVLREFRTGDSVNAVITRNSYGALVMNTRDLMFVDIDREDKPAGGGNLLSSVMSLFGKSKPEPPAAPVLSPAVAEIQRVAERNALSVRAYRTAAGYRALIVNARMEPGSSRSEALLKEFGSDDLYIRLCKTQESFRARLTPKPFRCGLPTPPVSFPYDGPNGEAMFREWEAKYNATIVRYATCRFVGSFGMGAMEAGFSELVDYHDRETKATSGLTLA